MAGAHLAHALAHPFGAAADARDAAKAGSQRSERGGERTRQEPTDLAPLIAEETREPSSVEVLALGLLADRIEHERCGQSEQRGSRRAAHASLACESLDDAAEFPAEHLT